MKQKKVPDNKKQLLKIGISLLGFLIFSIFFKNVQNIKGIIFVIVIIIFIFIFQKIINYLRKK